MSHKANSPPPQWTAPWNGPGRPPGHQYSGYSAQSQPQPPATAVEYPKKKRRIFLWIFLAMQILFLIWVIAGAMAGSSTHCVAGTTTVDCHNAHEVGTTIGTGIIILFWALADIIVGGGYAVYRLATRRR